MIPVFVGGCDRSGTTFLGSVLGGNSSCLTVPEFQFKIELLGRNTPGSHEIDIQAALRLLQSSWRFRIWSLSIQEILRHLADMEQPTSRDFVEAVVVAYGAATGQQSFSHWVDHTPSNMKDAALLLRSFPDARFIHLIRDGRAVAASVIPLAWGPNTTNTAAHWWLEKMAFGLANELALRSEQILRVTYEELVLDTVATSEKICTFLGLEFQPSMAQGTGFRVSDYTRKQHALVGQGPDVKRVTAWERELSKRDIEVFESVAGGLLETLGYELHSITRPPLTFPERFKAALIEVFRSQVSGRVAQKRRLALIKRTSDEYYNG